MAAPDREKQLAEAEEILGDLAIDIPVLTYVNNCPPHGFGYAVRRGLEVYSGDRVAAVREANHADIVEEEGRGFLSRFLHPDVHRAATQIPHGQTFPEDRLVTLKDGGQ